MNITKICLEQWLIKDLLTKQEVAQKSNNTINKIDYWIKKYEIDKLPEYIQAKKQKYSKASIKRHVDLDTKLRTDYQKQLQTKYPKELIFDELVNNNKSLYDISKTHNVVVKNLRKLAEAYKLYDNIKFVLAVSGPKLSKRLTKFITKQELSDFLKKDTVPAATVYYSKKLNTCLTENHLRRLCKHYGILIKGYNETANLPVVRQRYKQTLFEKYKVTNISQLAEIKKKKAQTFIKHYGVDNCFKDPLIQQLCVERIIEKYGSKYFRTKPHIMIENILTEQGVIFKSEEFHFFRKYNTELKRVFSPRPDILIKDIKLVIEINGDHWHANPLTHAPDRVVITAYGPLRAEEIWKMDKIRKEHIESFGYKVLTIWESDIKQGESHIMKMIQPHLQHAADKLSS